MIELKKMKTSIVLVSGLHCSVTPYMTSVQCDVSPLHFSQPETAWEQQSTGWEEGHNVHCKVSLWECPTVQSNRTALTWQCLNSLSHYSLTSTIVLEWLSGDGVVMMENCWCCRYLQDFTFTLPDPWRWEASSRGFIGVPGSELSNVPAKLPATDF